MCGGGRSPEHGRRAWPLLSVGTDLSLPRSPPSPTGSKKQNGGQGEFGRGAPPTPAVEFRGHCPQPQSKHSAFVPGTPGAAPSPSLARKAARQVLQPPEARLTRSLRPGFLGFSAARAGSNPAAEPSVRARRGGGRRGTRGRTPTRSAAGAAAHARRRQGRSGAPSCCRGRGKRRLGRHRRSSAKLPRPEGASDRWRRQPSQRCLGRGPPQARSRGSYRPARTARRAARRPTSAPCRPRPGQRPGARGPSQHVSVAPQRGRGVTWPPGGGRAGPRRRVGQRTEGADSAPLRAQEAAGGGRVRAGGGAAELTGVACAEPEESGTFGLYKRDSKGTMAVMSAGTAGTTPDRRTGSPTCRSRKEEAPPRKVPACGAPQSHGARPDRGRPTRARAARPPAAAGAGHGARCGDADARPSAERPAVCVSPVWYLRSGAVQGHRCVQFLAYNGPSPCRPRPLRRVRRPRDSESRITRASGSEAPVAHRRGLLSLGGGGVKSEGRVRPRSTARVGEVAAGLQQHVPRGPSASVPWLGHGAGACLSPYPESESAWQLMGGHGLIPEGFLSF